MNRRDFLKAPAVDDAMLHNAPTPPRALQVAARRALSSAVVMCIDAGIEGRAAHLCMQLDAEIGKRTPIQVLRGGTKLHCAFGIEH